MKVSERVRLVVDAVREHGIRYVEEKFNLTSETIYRYERMVKMEQTKKAKILIFDIEVSPIEAYAWGSRMYDVSIPYSFVKKQWYMLSWSAKWLNDSEMYSAVLTPKEAKKGNDRRIVKTLWQLFDEADIVVAHNAVKFDVGMANTRFIKHGLTRPSPYRVIDTLRIARKEFNFTHNHLDALGSFLGLGNKIKTEFQLWLDCMAGNKEALTNMSTYNDQDVTLLEEVYYKLRSWTNHINLAIYNDNGNLQCTTCESENLTKKGQYVTQVSSYNTYLCNDCGSYSRERKADKSKKVALTSVSR